MMRYSPTALLLSLSGDRSNFFLVLLHFWEEMACVVCSCATEKIKT